MNQRRLGIVQPRRHITGHAKVWILVNGTRDQTGHVLLVAKDVRKRGAKRGSRLNCGKGNLANAVRIAKAKDALHLIERDHPLNFEDILVECLAATKE